MNKHARSALIFLVTVLLLSAFSTKTQKGSGKAYWSMIPATASHIFPDSVKAGTVAKYVTIRELVGPTAASSLIRIVSASIIGGVDTVEVGSSGFFEDFYAAGVDTVTVLTAGASHRLTLQTSN